MKFLNKMKKDQKGFTLVEIIVVLVILAVLAAFTIPTMIGFVNEAKGKAYIAEARMVYVAAQATATEYTAVGQNDLGSAAVGASSPSGASLTMFNYLNDDLTISADIPLETDKTTSYWVVGLTAAKVNSVVYVKGGYTVTLNAKTGGTTVVKGVPSSAPTAP